MTVGTLFHRTRVGLGVWFRAIALMEESPKDPTVRELAAALKVNRNTACYMAMRIRCARARESALLWAIREEMKT